MATKPKQRTDPMIVKGDIVLFICEGDDNHDKKHRVEAVYIDPDGQIESATLVPLDDGLEELDTPIEGYLRLIERAGAATETSADADHEAGDAIPQQPASAGVSSQPSPAAADTAAGVSSEATPPKRRGRPPKTDNAVLAQSDEALVSQLREVLTLKSDLDEKTASQRSANSSYRSAIKIAVKIGAGIGLTSADVVWLVTASERDPNEIDLETRRRNRLAELMKLPIGTQLGLLDGQPGAAPVSVATRIEDRKIATGQTGAETTDQQVELAGYKAYKLGMTSAEVPAFDAPDDRRKDLWMAGWNRAKDEVAQKAAAALSKPHPTPGTKKGNGQHAPVAVTDALAPKPLAVGDIAKIF